MGFISGPVHHCKWTPLADRRRLHSHSFFDGCDLWLHLALAKGLSRMTLPHRFRFGLRTLFAVVTGALLMAFAAAGITRLGEAIREARQNASIRHAEGNNLRQLKIAVPSHAESPGSLLNNSVARPSRP